MRGKLVCNSHTFWSLTPCPLTSVTHSLPFVVVCLLMNESFQVNPEFERDSSISTHPDGLERASLRLRFTIQKHHFKNGLMRLKCVASVRDVYAMSNEAQVDIHDINFYSQKLGGEASQSSSSFHQTSSSSSEGGEEGSSVDSSILPPSSSKKTPRGQQQSSSPGSGKKRKKNRNNNNNHNGQQDTSRFHSSDTSSFDMTPNMSEGMTMTVFPLFLEELLKFCLTLFLLFSHPMSERDH